MQPSTNPTQLSDVVIVIIRICAIKLGLDATTSLLARYHTDPSRSIGFGLLCVVAVVAFGLWQASPSIARYITRGHDSSVSIGSLALSDLYTFAFLLVGLYFTVEGFGPSMTWLHYSLRQSSADAPLSEQQLANFYALFKYLAKLGLGLVLTFKGRSFAIRLIKHQQEKT
jgi:hypothetical protein